MIIFNNHRECLGHTMGVLGTYLDQDRDTERP